jgi:hypothetical protein
LYVVGNFEETVDFDPGDGVNNEYSHGGVDAYVSKFNIGGAWGSAATWGGDGNDKASAVHCFDASDPKSTWVVGSFETNASFNNENRQSNGKTDAYIYNVSYFSTVVTFGGPGEDIALGISEAEHWDNMLVTGIFEDQVNFNQYGSEIHTSNGSFDAFLVEYNYDEEYYYDPIFSWARTWGGPGLDYANDVCVMQKNIYVTGSFSDTVNFNPDPGGTPHNETAAGWSDAYVTHLVYGDFADVTTWGGSESLKIDAGYQIAANSSGNIICTGSFAGSSFGTASHGNYDAVVAEYSPSLNFISATTWGGTGSDGCNGMRLSYWDRIFVTGGFQSTVDFNPGPGVDSHTSNGGTADCYLMKLLPDGSW